MRIFYLKVDEKVELENRDIRIADVANLLCEDDRAQREAQELIVYRFSGEGRTVIDVLRLVSLLHDRYPGCQVVSLGADAVLVECHTVKPHPVWEKIKIALIALLCFFGAAFTIMAFHNDISIDDIFSKVYRLVTGMESDGFTALEISYSIGLSAGIILFFNHIGARRITKDPTPIEVQMRQYEGDVVTALVETANRERANRESVNWESADDKSANREYVSQENANWNNANRENVSRENANRNNANRENVSRENANWNNANRENVSQKNGNRKNAGRKNENRHNGNRENPNRENVNAVSLNAAQAWSQKEGREHTPREKAHETAHGRSDSGSRADSKAHSESGRKP